MPVVFAGLICFYYGEQGFCEMFAVSFTFMMMGRFMEVFVELSTFAVVWGLSMFVLAYFHHGGNARL